MPLSLAAHVRMTTPVQELVVSGFILVIVILKHSLSNQVRTVGFSFHEYLCRTLFCFSPLDVGKKIPLQNADKPAQKITYFFERFEILKLCLTIEFHCMVLCAV